jgi:hypothetical protein
VSNHCFITVLVSRDMEGFHVNVWCNMITVNPSNLDMPSMRSSPVHLVTVQNRVCLKRPMTSHAVSMQQDMLLLTLKHQSLRCRFFFAGCAAPAGGEKYDQPKAMGYAWQRGVKYRGVQADRQ